MELAALIDALRPLVTGPEPDVDAAVRLLDDHTELAEYEVARFYASRALAPLIAGLARDADPDRRQRALRIVRAVMARTPAASLLRRMVKDRSRRVRRFAWSTVRHLELDDVALPESVAPQRIPARKGINPFTGEAMIIPARVVTKATGVGALPIGGFNPSGWNFGLYRNRARKHRRVDALAELRSEEDVARLVGCDDLAKLTPLTRPGTGPGAPYVAFEVPKATGGVRQILAPRGTLKKVQRLLLDFVLEPIGPHEACHGFVAGRSVLTNAKVHERAALVVKIDIEDFFPTIHYHRVAGLFSYYGAKPEAAALLARLCTHLPLLPDGRVAWPGVLPQGAPTSPAIANLVCRRLDARLSGLAEKVGARYTRYADDLTFSFAEVPERGLGRFFWWVDQVLGQEGFFENVAKRRVLRPSAQQRVTGLVVNDGPRVPRDARRAFRALLHRCETQGISEATVGHPEPLAYLLGFAAWLRMVQPDAGAQAVARIRAMSTRRDGSDPSTQTR